MPKGLKIIEVKPIRLDESALTKGAHIITYEIEYQTELKIEEVKENIQRLILRESLPYTRVREKKTQEINLRPFIKSLDLILESNCQKLKMELIYSERGTVKPEEIFPLIFGECGHICRLCRLSLDKLWGGNFV